MPRQSKAMKDVRACEKLRGVGNYAEIRRYLNGETYSINTRVSITEYINDGSKPGELKHLSTQRKRNQPRFRK